MAEKLWGGVLPDRDPAALVRELYAAENAGQAEPSGSQDMIGLIYPGVNRLDYRFDHEGGYFPAHIESNNDPGRGALAGARHLDGSRWCSGRPAMARSASRTSTPSGSAGWGRAAKIATTAIVAMDGRALGASMNECMACWEAILPHTVRHPTITVDLMGILSYYQARYAGAMYSGAAGGICMWCRRSRWRADSA